MIHLVAISKSYLDKRSVPKLIFRRTTVTFPTDRRVALLAGRMKGKSVLLRIVAGLEDTDEGEVIAPVRLSPMTNGGTILDSQLSGNENIRFLARTFGVDHSGLTAAVLAFCQGQDFLNIPLRAVEGVQRRTLEIALAAVLPFDCYLIDHVSSLSPELLDRYFSSVARRGAGVIFATTRPNDVRRYADYVAVIADHTVYPFQDIDEAIEFHERKET